MFISVMLSIMTERTMPQMTKKAEVISIDSFGRKPKANRQSAPEPTIIEMPNAA
jgi:hypothetical protein